MKQTIFLLISFFIVAPLFAQLDKTYQDNKLIYYETPIEESEFFKLKAKELFLNEGYSMIELKSDRDLVGIKHTRYSQHYNGYRVIGGTYILHSRNGKVFKSSGSLFPNVEVADRIVVKQGTAFELAKTHFSSLMVRDLNVNNSVDLDFEVRDDARICIIDQAFPDFSGVYRMAHELTLDTRFKGLPYAKTYYIDVLSGEVIFYEDQIIHEMTPATGESNYHGLVEFETEQLGPNLYELTDLSRGNGIFINDIYNDGESFINNSTYWDYSSTSERAAIDVMHGTQKFYDFLQERFGLNSIDGAGFNLVCNVHYPGYVNAFWNGSETTYGSGNCDRFGPLTSIDIVAHEFAHGLTSFTSRLVYSKESGALNESISDIFGKTVEHYAHPNEFDWWLAGKITIDEDDDPIRSMEDPNLLGDPKYYRGDFWEFSSADNYGVHSNSGVMNYWYYLLVEGGSGTNEAGDDFDVTGIGFEKAIRIVYSAESFYLTENSPYTDAYIYTREAAIDLYGENSVEYNAVLDAWFAAGVSETRAGFDNEIQVTALIDGIPDSESTFTIFCKDNLGDIEISLRNADVNPIPQGMRIQGSIIHDDINFTKDTAYFDFVLSDDLAQFGEVTLTSVGISDPDNYSSLLFFYDMRIEFSKDGISETVVSDGFLRVNADLEEDFTFNNSFSMELEDICDANSAFNSVNYNVVNEGCVAMNDDDEIEFIIRADGNERSERFNVGQRMFFTNSVFFFSLVSDLNLFSVADKRSISLNSIYHTADGRQYPMDTVDFVDYIPRILGIGEVLAFDEQMDSEFIGVELGAGDNVLVQNEELIISKSFFNEDNINDCLPLDQYLYTLNNGGFFSLRSLTSISICVEDVEFTDVEPYLLFDLYYEENEVVPDVGSEYFHLIQIFEGGEALGQPITAAENKFEEVEQKLSLANSNRIRIDVLAGETKVYMDNIRIELRPVSNEEFPASSINIYPNPTSEIISIENGDFNSGQLKFFDLSGRLVEQLTLSNTSEELNVSHWNSGIYYYQFESTNNGEVKQGKLVVLPQ